MLCSIIILGSKPPCPPHSGGPRSAYGYGSYKATLFYFDVYIANTVHEVKSPQEAPIVDKVLCVCSALNNLCVSVVPFY